MILRRILFAVEFLLWAVAIAITELFLLFLWTLLLTLVGLFAAQVVGAVIGVIQHPTAPEGWDLLGTVYQWVMRTSPYGAIGGAIIGVLSGIGLAAKAVISELSSARQERRTTDYKA
jgi:hypothetical protein